MKRSHPNASWRLQYNISRTTIREAINVCWSGRVIYLKNTVEVHSSHRKNCSDRCTS
jgi:hypothetical protein